MSARYPFPVGVKDFLMGNEAIARAAVLAGCRFYAGYPITPATEVFEEISRILPPLGGVVLQMEDELASINAVCGASWAGAKAMTATSGPGFSLMMEGLGWAIMTETPLVLVNAQRVGPSTGIATLGAQGDIMQAIWGRHGDQALIILSPATVQEAFNMTIKAFNLSEKYRTPVILLTDGETAHLREAVEVPNPEDIQLESRKLPVTDEEIRLPWKDHHGDKIPPMPVVGKGYRAKITGLTHDESGRNVENPKIHDKLVRRIVAKIMDNAKKLFEYEAYYMDDANVGIVSTGIESRVSISAVKQLRKEGVKAGLIKLNVLWPIDFEILAKSLANVERVYTVEMNLGQLYHIVRECVGSDIPVKAVTKLGGEPHTPHEVVEFIKQDVR